LWHLAFRRPDVKKVFLMVRIALAYLAIAVAGIFLVTGLPFGLSGPDEPEVATVQVVEPEIVDSAENEGFLASVGALFAGSDAPDMVAVATPAPKQVDPAALVTQGSIAETTALILKELAAPAPQAAGSAVAANDVEMSPDLQATVLVAGLTDDGTSELSIEGLLARALAAGQSAQEIDRLINEAASQGSVRIPAMLVTTEGRVDTTALMASVVARTKGATPREQGDTSGGDAFVTPETAILDIEDLSYLVQIGDSMGGLALKFYGNPELFKPIFEANRQILATPSSIRAGQTLLIPSRSKL
jgi:nucleoid-associated protein YgaU